MNCRRADQLFSAAWEDELTLVERETLESHMASCTACRVAYDEFVRVMEAVQGLPKMDAGSEFVEGVWSRIRAVESPRARGVRLAWSWSWASFRPALAAAACLVVVGSAVAYWQNHSGPHSGASPSPATELRQAPLPVAMAPAEPSESSTPNPTASHPLRDSNRHADKALAKQANEAPASVPGTETFANRLQVKAGERYVDGFGASGAVASRSVGDSAAISDSLFNHSYDVEFALDPVRLSKSGKGKLSPSRPVPTEEQGKPAKVTF